VGGNGGIGRLKKQKDTVILEPYLDVLSTALVPNCTLLYHETFDGVISALEMSFIR